MPNLKQLLYSQTSVQMPIEKQLLNNPPDICSNAYYKTQLHFIKHMTPDVCSMPNVKQFLNEQQTSVIMPFTEQLLNEQWTTVLTHFKEHLLNEQHTSGLFSN